MSDATTGPETTRLDWLCSSDEEAWDGGLNFATREEAIAAAPNELGLEPGDRFFTGRRVPQRTTDLVTPGAAEQFAEGIAEHELYDLAPDGVGEGWLNLNREEASDLAKLLSEALERFIAATPRHQPTFFLVRDVEEHEAPPLLGDES